MAGLRERAGGLALKVAARLNARRYVALGPTDHALVLEQPPNVRTDPRWGHGKPFHSGLAAVLGKRDHHYAELLGFLERYGSELAAIPREEGAGSEPCWINDLFSGIDAASLYAFLRDRDPAGYVEIGSGHSTRFADRARRDGSLRTEITSIDPMPRADIDALCDHPIRRRLEDVELSLFDELRAGDILFFDGSHRVFMNNDVSAFWLDVMPRLRAGVLVGIHDILLPEDYPETYHPWYWSEQYMLGVALLFANGRLRPVLPCHYVSVEPSLRQRLIDLFVENGLADVNGYGTTFWFELT